MVAVMSKRVALGPAIKAIRTAKGMPGGKFATACLISHAHLCNIESGKRQPSDEHLTAIASVLEVSPDAISYVCQKAHLDDARSAA